jgi:hypothetical protein
MRTVYVLMAMVLLVAAVSVSACQPTTGGDNLSGSAIGDPSGGTPQPAVKGPEKGSDKPAVDVAGAVTGVCELAQSNPMSEVKLDELNAKSNVIDDLKAALADFVASPSLASSPNKVAAEKLASGDKVSAKDACATFKELSDAQKAAMASGGELGLAAALSSLGPDGMRIRLGQAEKACGDDQLCLDELAKFTELLKESCQSADSCPDTSVAMPLILGRDPTKQQEQAGICPATDCATIGDIQGKLSELGVSGGVSP